MVGFIKLHRKLQEWEWYNKSEMVHLFIHLLINANSRDKQWQNIIVKRGQMVTGFSKLSEKTGISIRTLRTCFERLKSTGELSVKTTNKYSVITICKYDDYNDNKKEIDKQNDTQHVTPPTTTKKYKKKEELNDIVFTDLELAFNAYIEMRKVKRAPLTEKAKLMIEAKLNQYSNGDEKLKIQILNRSTENSWTGVFPLQEQKNDLFTKPKNIVEANIDDF